MAKKTKATVKLNPSWEVSYSYQHGRDLIEVGDLIKIKFERGVYKFMRLIHHIDKDVYWIDCTGPDGYRSFYVENLKGKIKPKKTRRKKDAV